MPLGRAFARALAGVAGTELGLRLAGRTSAWVGPLKVRAGLGFARSGGLRVDAPPLGEAHLRTHRGPLQLRAVATDVDPSRARGLLRMPEGDDKKAARADADAVHAQLDAALGAAGRDVRQLGTELATRSALAGLGGAAGLAAVVLRRPGDVVASAGVAAALLGASAAVAAATLDRTAWRDPQLTGLLTKAPLILGDLRQAPANINRYRDQLAELLHTGTSVYRRVVELPDAPPDDAIRLVHISDIHLSPLALPLAKALVDEYRADAVIDTGDLVDWGTPPEGALAGQIPQLGVPYVFVKGNHDSPGIAAAVAKQPNAVVLDADDAPVDVAGLRFTGMADPRFTPDKTTGDDHAHHRIAEAAELFAGKLGAHGQHIDIALVHSPAAGRALAGLVPLVLAGDIHRREVRRFGDTTMLVQGSSGGAGLRGVQQDPPTPLTLSVLYLDRTTHRLWGTDEVTLGGIGSTELSVVRRTAADLLGRA